MVMMVMMMVVMMMMMIMMVMMMMIMMMTMMMMMMVMMVMMMMMIMMIMMIMMVVVMMMMMMMMMIMVVVVVMIMMMMMMMMMMMVVMMMVMIWESLDAAVANMTVQYGDSSRDRLLDKVQRYTKCCGMMGPSDWLTNCFIQNVSGTSPGVLPCSCFNSSCPALPGAPLFGRGNNSYEEGCKEKISDWLEENALTIVGMDVSLMFIQVVQFVVAVYLYRAVARKASLKGTGRRAVPDENQDYLQYGEQNQGYIDADEDYVDPAHAEYYHDNHDHIDPAHPEYYHDNHDHIDPAHSAYMHDNHDYIDPAHSSYMHDNHDYIDPAHSAYIHDNQDYL
uniref:Tetraspanin n=1 Tax=Myripristis murdjan TaxID=586833 RepID=A0A667ZPS9_9TELE